MQPHTRPKARLALSIGAALAAFIPLATMLAIADIPSANAMGSGVVVCLLCAALVGWLTWRALGYLSR